MSWSYSGNPSTSPLDALRFYIGDTDPSDPLIDNEELEFLLQAKGSPKAAAPFACQNILMRLARAVDYTIGPESVKASKRLDNYKKAMDALKELWAGEHGAPSWDSSILNCPPIFSIGMNDNKGGGA